MFCGVSIFFRLSVSLSSLRCVDGWSVVVVVVVVVVVQDLQVAAVIMMRRAQWFLMSLPIVAAA